MKHSKYLSVFVLMLLALLLTGFTFAYWAGNIQAATLSSTFAGDTVEIGAGKDVVTQLEVKNSETGSEKLVPSKYVDKNTVGSITRKFTVAWDETAEFKAGNGAVGTVVASDIKVLVGEKDVTHLFTVNFTSPEVELNKTADMEFTISFKDEPKDKAEYDLVAGKDLTIKVTLNVSENQ